LSHLNFFGFDSFEGLPDIAEVDTGAKFKKGGYACTMNKVIGNLKKNDVDMKRIHLIKGYYSNTLNDETVINNNIFGLAKIVMIDCDLYESTKDVLKFIGPRLQNGTIVIMDDWNCFDADDHKGERRATHEFLLSHPNMQFNHIVDFGWHGACFRVKIN